MGEFAARFEPGIDLDEFERRLRVSGAPARPSPSANADPLAELARLVGGEKPGRQDPFEALFRAQAAISDLHRDALHGDAGAPPVQAPHEPYFADAQAMPSATFVEDQHFGGAEAYGDGSSWASHPAEPALEWPTQEEPAPRAPAAGRSRKVVYSMGAILLLGVASFAGTLAIRHKSGARDVVTIQADADPARVQPAPAAAAADQANVFDKASNDVAKVVTKAEQPADLTETVKAARVVGAAAGVATPVPPPPAQAAPVAPTAQAQGETLFPSPKKVKTVSIRADGSVIGAEPRPQGPSAVPSMVGALGGPNIRIASTAPANSAPTPSAAAPSAAAPAKIAERVASVAPAVAPVVPAAPKPVAAKPVAAKPVTRTAAAPADPEIGGETGVYAVQLAGSPAESEARAAANTLSARYASALKGRHATFVEAQVNGKAIYRVRIGHLTQDAARSMCAAIKGQGGNCFVAKN